MKRTLFLVFWIVGILFPMGWFIRVSPLGYRLFNSIFSPQWMHILMHTLLFSVLGALIMYALHGKLPGRLAVGVALTLVFGVAVLQEGIQLMSEQLPVHGDNFFDLAVDMAGGLIGVAVAVGLKWMLDRRLRASQSAEG